MKKLFVVVFVMGRLHYLPAGQKLNESQVPVPAKTAFEKKYPGIKASWDKEDANYEANFKQGWKGYVGSDR
jgi:hypothetical protein